MALFNVPFPQDDHALLAVQVGFKMQEVHGELMKVWRGKGVDTTPIGVGIATGELIVGEMGCSLRTDYTAIGRAANLGSRICEIAAGGSVMVSQETFNLIKQYVDATPVHGLSLKGIGANVTAYQINRILVAKS
jgi:adenylate cyclase